MRRRFPTAAILAALLTVYLGLPCLVLAQAHAAMARDHDAMAGETAATPCETSGEPAAELLCAAPSVYAPLTTASPDLGTAALTPVAFPPVHVAAPHPAQSPSSTTSRGDHPPAFLLHRALLI